MILPLFCASGSSVEDKVRTIHEASVHVNETGDELTFTFRGDGFLYKMIRILVGTLLKIGNGRLEPTVIPAIIAAKRSKFSRSDCSSRRIVFSRSEI